MSAWSRPLCGREAGSLPIFTASAGCCGAVSPGAARPVSGQIFDDTTGCGRVVDVWVLVEPEPEVVVVDEDVEAPFGLPPAKTTTSTDRKSTRLNSSHLGI